MSNVSIPENVSGTVNISFQLATTNGNTVYARLRKNGAIIGTEQSILQSGADPCIFSATNWINQTISTTLNTTDTLELWGNDPSSGYSVCVQNFRLMYDLANLRTLTVLPKDYGFGFSGRLNGEMQNPLLMTNLTVQTAMTSANLIAISDSSTSSVLTPAGASANYDTYAYVNFSVPRVNVVQNVTISSNSSVSSTGENVHMGIYDRANSRWDSKTTYTGTGYKTLSWVMTGSDIAKYSTIDANNNLNFSVALWTNGTSSRNMNVNMISAILKYDSIIIAAPNICANGLCVYFDQAAFSFRITKNGVNITINDANDTASFFQASINGTLYSSKDSINLPYTNSSNSVNFTWSYGNMNETLSFKIIDENHLNISRMINSTGSNTVSIAEINLPMLNGANGDYIFWMNKTLAGNKQALWTPYISGSNNPSGVFTRYASYDSDFGTVISNKNNSYYQIQMSGDLSVTKSVRQSNSDASLYFQQTPAGNKSLFSFGLITNWTDGTIKHPNFEPVLNMTNGQSVYQNLSFIFNNEQRLLPLGNPIINYTRYNDFVNTSIADDAVFMAASIIGTRIYSNWYPNGSLPYIWDSAGLYVTTTPSSGAKTIQGNYYFLNSSGKTVLQTWLDGVEYATNLTALSTEDKFEVENYTTIPSGWTTLCSNSTPVYSGNCTIYTTSASAPIQMNFTGDSVTLFTTTYDTYGDIIVGVDGTNYTVSQHGTGLTKQVRIPVPVPKLAYNPGRYPQWGTHSLKLYSNGTTQVEYDAIIIGRNDTQNEIPYVVNNNASEYYKTKKKAITSDLFEERWNVTINGTTYPYNIKLWSEAEPRRGATILGQLEWPLAYWSIYQTDKNTTWISSRLPMLNARMKWMKGLVVNETSGLIQIDPLLYNTDYVDALPYTGKIGTSSSVYIQDADIMASLYGALGDSTNQNYWIAERNMVQGNITKDITQGGLWLNETACPYTPCGHLISGIETTVPVRVEAEEPDVLNASYWSSADDVGNYNGYYVSGRRWRPWNASQDNMQNLSGPTGAYNPSSRIFYYVLNDTNPINYTFFGTGISVVTIKSSSYGIMNFTVDNNANVTIDLYKSGATQAGYVIAINKSLPLKWHTVIAHYTGTKNAASSNYYAVVDAFEVDNMTVPGMQVYSMTPHTTNLLPSWNKNATENWLLWHEGNGTYDNGTALYTDYTYPFAPAGGKSIGSFPNDWINTWGHHLDTDSNCAGSPGCVTFNNEWATHGFENGGHFPYAAAMSSRVTGNYADMQPYINSERIKEGGMLEWYWPNGTEATSAIYEDQMSGGFMTGFVDFWGASYLQASDIIPPTSITNPNMIIGSNYINNTWTKPNDPDFNITSLVNESDPNNPIWIADLSNTTTYNNTGLSPHYQQNISAVTCDVLMNCNQTKVWFNATIPNNVPVQASIGNKNVTAGSWLNFTVNATDVDSDTITYGTNASKGTLNTATGNFNWSTTESDVGTYYWNFNSSDAYGGVDDENITVTVNSSCIITGTGYNTTEDTNINNQTSWTNCNATLSGNININGTGNLTIDNTIIIFNNSYNGQYFINMTTTSTAGKLQIINGSKITVSEQDVTLENFTYIYQSSNINIPAHLEIRDSTLDRMGSNSSQYSDNLPFTAIRSTSYTIYPQFDNTSIIYNTSFTNVTGAVLEGGNYPINITDSRITTLDYSGGRGMGIEPRANVYFKIWNNTFSGYRNATTGITRVKYINALYGSTNIDIYNNTFTHNNDTGYSINLEQPAISGYTIRNNHFKNAKRSVVLNHDLSNIIIENNTYDVDVENWVYTGFSPVVSGNYNASNITVRNNIANNGTDNCIASHSAYGLGVTNWTVYNNSCYNLRLTTTSGLAGAFQNSSFYDNYFSGVQGSSQYGITMFLTSINLEYSRNNIYTNNTVDSFNTGIRLNTSVNNTFRDTNISNSSTYDIDFRRGNTQTLFINTLFNNSKINFTDSIDRFENYYYSDINVINSTGSPISGATISFTNTVNASYPSINRAGTTIASYTTDSSGHTPLPKGNDSTTVVLMNVSMNSTTQQNMNYTVTVSAPRYQTNSSVIIVPLSSWYRPNPNTYQNTTTITLTEATEPASFTKTIFGAWE